MSRYSNPVPEILDNNGDPIVGAKTYFYESGTTTLKTVYSDSDLSVAIANPVIADAGGRLPSIFLDGIYKVEQRDQNDVTIWTRDTVGSISTSQFSDWINDFTYSINDIVRADDDQFRILCNGSHRK